MYDIIIDDNIFAFEFFLNNKNMNKIIIKTRSYCDLFSFTCTSEILLQMKRTKICRNTFIRAHESISVVSER